MPLETLLRDAIAGVSVVDLARAFGTPTYVYDEAAVRARIGELRRFDLIRYAQKANSSLAILDLCRREGVVLDAVSAGEIARGLRAGYAAQGDPDPIVSTADLFDRESLECVIKHGVRVNCGSPDMIDQYGIRARGNEIILRINPGFGHGHSQKTNTGGAHSKHGIWHEDLEECVERAARYDLRVSGIHVHIGSGVDMDHLSRVAGAAVGFARRVGPSVSTLSAGGGLPTRYRPDDAMIDLDAYFEIWDTARRALAADLGHSVRLEIEPGRYLVADAGFLVTEIRAIKRSGENLFYIVDAGFNTLARPVIYGAYQPMSLARRTERAGAGTTLRDVVVGGPLCESGDIFTQEEGGLVRSQALPDAEVGDLLVIECAGAYGFVMASRYNAKPLPAEVLVRDGEAVLIRERENNDDLMRGERIP
jgi:diaminopimelate decarboxylase